MGKEFLQNEKQLKIYNFWKVRGYNIIKAVLGNLNVSFHKSKFDDLGLCYQYLEQFYDEAQKEAIAEYELKKEVNNG